MWLSAHGVAGFLYEFVERLFFRQRFEKDDEIGLFARAQVQAAQNPFTSGVQPFLVDRRIVVGDVGERVEAAGMHVGRGERHVAQARLFSDIALEGSATSEMTGWAERRPGVARL